MKKKYKVVRHIKGQLIDPTGKRIIDHVDAAELEAISKTLFPIIHLSGPKKKETVDSTR